MDVTPSSLARARAGARVRTARAPAPRASAARRGGRRARAGRARRARARSRRARPGGGRACGWRRGRGRRGARARASASASMPEVGRSEETASTGAAAPSVPSAARRSSSARRAGAPRSALVTTSTSGTSMIPAFRNCSASPRAGLHDDRDRVRRLGDVGLGLPDADGLDHDDVERGGQRLRRRAGRGREPAEPLAGGHRADEHVAVGGVVLDPRPVAEQRAAGALRRRVDGEHGDAAAARRATRAAAPRAASTCPRPGGPVTPTMCPAPSPAAETSAAACSRAVRVSSRFSAAGAAERSPGEPRAERRAGPGHAIARARRRQRSTRRLDAAATELRVATRRRCRA